MPQSQSLTSAVHHQFRTPWIAVCMGLIYSAGLVLHLLFFLTGYRDAVAPFTNPAGGVAFVASVALVVRAQRELERADKLAQQS